MVLFFSIYFPEKAHVGLPIGEDNMLFTPHYVLSYSAAPVWQIENVLTYNLAKSTLYLHRDTFFFFGKGPLCAGVHKSVLSLDAADEQHSE